jgi:hypothetical protein
MEDLPETRNALMQMLSDEQMRAGVHLADYVTVGAVGVPVGERIFDPHLHSVEDIDLMWMTGMPHVEEVVPFKPLEMNVVLHRNPNDKRMPDWLKPLGAYKQEVASNVASAVFEAKQFGDEANYFVVGDTENESLTDWNAEIVRDTEDPEAASQAIADICLRGLTFVISDFNDLKIQNNSGVQRSVAIKVNHSLELEVPKVKAIIPFGGLKEVNASNKKQLAKFNEELERTHSDIRLGLGSAGLVVAQVVLDMNKSGSLNAQATDSVIAHAIQSVISR